MPLELLARFLMEVSFVVLVTFSFLTCATLGKKNRPMYDPSIPFTMDVTKEQYMKLQHIGAPTINHFYEKLLLLKDMMKTETGKQLAQQRHAFMEQFLDVFYKEWEGQA